MPMSQSHDRMWHRERDRIWRAIDAHPMPENFTSGLMHAHSIKRETAERAILEYKRFIFLVATAEGVRRVPSKAVDHVWHAHMMHSRDYWDVFCAAIGQPIHHTPGGAGAEHLEDYHATQRAYVKAFDEAPAKGIWRKPPRFGTLGFAIVGAIFVAGGLSELLNGHTIGLLIAAVGALSFGFGVYAQTTRGQYYLTFEASGEFADDAAGDCGDGGGCGGD